MQIKIRVVTSAKKERILKAREHLSRASEATRGNPYEYKVYVSTPPEKGKANARIVELFADFFKVSRRNVSISSGLKSKDKTIVVKGTLTPSVARDKL